MGKAGALNVFTIKDKSQSPVQSIVMPGSKATCARWGNLNKTIYTGHEDGSIMAWDPVSGKKLNQVQAHTGAITDIQLAADCSFFISSSKDCSAKIFDAQTLKHLKTYTSDRPLNSAAMSPLFDQVIVGGGQDARDVTTTSSRAGRFEICFYHRVFESELARMKSHFSPINTLAFHPSGKSFASGAEEGYVRIYHFDQDYFEFRY